MGHDKLGSALKSFVALKKPYFRGLSVSFASSFLPMCPTTLSQESTGR